MGLYGEHLIHIPLLRDPVVTGCACLSVLIKFNDLFEIEKYIQVPYLEYRDRQQAYFQIQFIEVAVGSIEKTEIYLQFPENARREHDGEHSDSINKRQQVYYSNFQGPPQHCRIN